MISNDNTNEKSEKNSIASDSESTDFVKSNINLKKSLSISDFNFDTVTVTITDTGKMMSSASECLLEEDQTENIDEISGSDVEADSNNLQEPIVVPRTTPFKSAQRRWSLNFAKNRKYIYQRTINLMPSRRLRLSVDLLNQKYENIEQLTQDFEEHEELMQQNRIAEQKRVQTIKSLPQSLSVKRQIRANLNRSVQRRSSSNNDDFWKKFKNNCQLFLQSCQSALKWIQNIFDMWYSSLKEVEGHFGSSVGAYFKFLRFLFILNMFGIVLIFSMVVIPQLLSGMKSDCSTLFKNDTSVSSLFETIKDISSSTEESNFISSVDYQDEQIRLTTLENTVVRENVEETKFHFMDLITGQGWLANSILFYGSYSNESMSINCLTYYNTPFAYFLTITFFYAMVFIIISISVGRSYRRSFIESSSSVHKLFSHKILCSWDYGISNLKAAQMKQKSIFLELRELLTEADTRGESLSIWRKLWNFMSQITSNIFIVFILFALGYGIYMLMEFVHYDIKNDSSLKLFYVPIVVNLSLITFHLIFRGMSVFEEYQSTGTVLHIHLFRNFLLELTLVCTLLIFWVQNTNLDQCWETALGQEIYRIILVDLVFSILGVPSFYAIRYILKRNFIQIFSLPAFDISYNCLALVFNQSFVWLGIVYVPLMPLILVVKLAIIFYVQKYVVIKFCKAPPKLWRTSQTQTLFLVLTFLSLFAVTIINGYIATQTNISQTCGPFRGREYMFEVVATEINKLKDKNIFWTIIASLTKPAVVAGILLTMCVLVYYLRAKSKAHKAMVKLLKEMLYLESKDKEFLLENIKRLTQDAGFIFDEPETVIKNGAGSIYRHRRNFSSGSYTGWLLGALSQSPHRRKSCGVPPYDKNK